MRTMTLLAMSLLLLSASLPHAAAVAGGGAPEGVPALGTIDVAGMFYVDDRGYPFGDGIWLYQEMNGEAGLQRGGCSPMVPNDCETRVDDSVNGPDQLWF